MNQSEEVRKIFAEYIQNNFHRSPEELTILIYGVEMQCCGGLLKYIGEGINISLICYDLRTVGKLYDGYRCCLPEALAPYEGDTVVLMSVLYEYQCEKIKDKLEALGLKRENMLQVRSLSEQILHLTADYFAAKGMDQRVAELFERTGRSISDITYLDIGANNYLLYNNTYLFYRAGANGVLVEANPDFYDILTVGRSKDKLLMCGCTADDKEGEILTYYKTNRAGYNTFDVERAKRFQTSSKEIEVLEEIEVPMRGINSIIEEYFPDSHIDYLSVDIEGMGEEVVYAIDFDRYEVDVILIEMEYDSDLSRQLYAKLDGIGYEMQYQGIGGDKDFLFYKKSVFMNNNQR